MWLNQSVNRLVQKGHRLQDIQGYSLSQFQMCVNAAAEMDAADRLSFVTDMSTVVGALFSKDSPIQEHVRSLEEYADGGKHGA